MEKRVKRKKQNPIKFIILFSMCALSLFFISASVNEVIQMFTLKANITAALEEQEALTQKKEDLQEEKKNLENPEYLLRYARGKYLVTKDDGEQVFKLPEDSE